MAAKTRENADLKRKEGVADPYCICFICEAFAIFARLI
jgi:hypothetical protein